MLPHDDPIMRAKCDQACKRVLAEKVILAQILKHCTEEFRSCDPKEIETKYIEGDPDISDTPIRPDTPKKITGLPTEDYSISENTIYYDIRFRASLPDNQGDIGLIINVEAQNRYNTGYPLIKRGLFYCSRMISSQYNTEFSGSHYENIKKVYSIWICMSAPKNKRGTITEYAIQENNLIGNASEPKANYDLLRAVMVCLNREGEPSDDNFLNMLNVLFAERISAQEKNKKLQTDFGIDMSDGMIDEVEKMCNLSYWYEENGIQKGSELGRKEESVMQKYNSISQVMKSLNTNFTSAANILDIPEDERDMFESLILGKESIEDVIKKIG